MKKTKSFKISLFEMMMLDNDDEKLANRDMIPSKYFSDIPDTATIYFTIQKIKSTRINLQESYVEWPEMQKTLIPIVRTFSIKKKIQK